MVTLTSESMKEVSSFSLRALRGRRLNGSALSLALVSGALIAFGSSWNRPSLAYAHTPAAGSSELSNAPASLKPPSEPARGAKRVLKVIEEVEKNLVEGRYQARTVVNEKRGYYAWDCSGMAGWMLKRAAPVAYKALRKKRAAARDFVYAIARSPTSKPLKGWQRISDIRLLQAGDVFAWLRPPDWPARNTGHIGFVAEPARPILGIPNAYTLRIIDSTSVPHQDDTRADSSTGGFGMGVLLFITNDDGHPTAYGWHGSQSAWVVPTQIVFGRLHG